MLQERSIVQDTGANQDWPRVLDEYGVQFVILDVHSDGDLLKLFQSQPGWAVDFQDGETMIFARAEIV